MARLYRPAQPYIAATAGTVDERLQLIADAVARKADSNAQVAFTSIVLIAPDKSRWVVAVDNAGALTTEQIT